MSEELRNDANIFTCLSCSIAFLSPEDQRIHYRSDHHRYNMKRRVAALPPISIVLFNQKVLERREETAVMSSAKGSTCTICNKTYTTENAYRSHMQSKKHKENESKKDFKSSSLAPPRSPSQNQRPVSFLQTALKDQLKNGDASKDEVVRSIDAKIAAARSRLSENNCLFCNQESSSLDESLTHMSSVHSFFVPDAEYLTDLPGLIIYLGEKIAVGNICIYCSEKGREFRTLDAVRKHMVDKSHCKIAYESEKDRLEISDYYDFTASYQRAGEGVNEEDSWDDDDNIEEEDVDEILEEPALSSGSEDDDIPANQLTYGDTEYELVLPSGTRIGHRTLRRYYAQSFPVVARGNKPEDPTSGAALVRRLLADKNAALVPRKGGFGAYGSGTEVVKARNRGEAQEAGRHVKEFRDQKRREDFKTRVGFIHNAQKHYRDPLLQ